MESELQEKLPNSQLMVFSECGHLPHEEYPEAFTEVVTEFLQDAARVPLRPNSPDPGIHRCSDFNRNGSTRVVSISKI